MTTAAVGLRINVAPGIFAAGIVALAMMALVTAQMVSARPHPAAIAQTPRVSTVTAVTPDPVEQLDRLTVATSFRATSSIHEPLDAFLEIQPVSGGATVLATHQSGFRVPDGGARDIYWVWRVPASVPPGEYSLRTRVIGLDTGTVYGEEQRAARFEVRDRP